MARLDELVTAEFAAWEQRGRGWHVWPVPVRPEPPFREFGGYQLPDANAVPDDSRKPGFLASLVDVLEKKAMPTPPPLPVEPEVDDPNVGEEPLTVEWVAHFPREADFGEDALRAFLDATAALREPVAFELVADPERVVFQFVASEEDAAALQRHLTTFFPKLSFQPAGLTLTERWQASGGTGFIIEFGLAHEFMLPLQTRHSVDPFAGLIAALSELRADETAVFQVLFEPVKHPWPGSVWRSVTDASGKALFINRPMLIPATKEKLAAPLFAAVVRAAAKADSFERAADVVIDVAGALRPFHRPEHNRLIPLHNEDYPYDLHEEDLLARQSRRGGMLLNREELLGLVHFPGDEVQSPRFRRQRAVTKAAPASVQLTGGIQLGVNVHAGRSTLVRLSPEQRVRHVHLIGASGTGKSTLLFNLISQDLSNGTGFAVLDPHGDLIEQVLATVPDERIEDVILLDPADSEYAVAFNILSAHDELEKSLLASDLVAVFQRLSSSWGDQMESVLRNAILAFLESKQGGTLADLRRFLLDDAFRNQFLKTVTDPELVYYWQKGFLQLSGKRSIGPVLTRLESFLAPKPLRAMVAQQVNRLDFRAMMTSGKILLAKLSQGLIGRENSHLLGSLLMARLQQAAMSRQSQQETDRRDFILYVDEFQNFITPSLTEILTDARKYRLGLVLAHHELRQLERDRDVASAVMSNTATRIVFKVSDEDARKLADGFSSFEARDLQNLGVGEAVCRLGKSDADFNLYIERPEPVEPDAAAERRARVIAASRERYATPRAEVEAQYSIPASPVEPVIASPPSQVTEVPKVTGSEKKPAPIAPKAEPPATAVTPEPGRGGEQHKAIQQRIKTVAEALGFRATVEKEVLEGDGSIDLALERADLSIACEVAITTTIDHEFGNVKKCLKAGFNRVAVISSRPERLEQIAKAVQGGLGAEAAAKVEYFSADDFIRHLQRLPVPASPPEPATTPTEKTTLGFKVRRHSAKLTPEERKSKEMISHQLLAEALKKKS